MHGKVCLEFNAGETPLANHPTAITVARHSESGTACKQFFFMELSSYLRVNDPSKEWVAGRLNDLLAEDSIVPAFPEVAGRLCIMAQNEDTTMDDFAAVISLDPGLATRCVQIASSVAFGARTIDNIGQAMMLIGVQQARRIALAVAAIGCFAGFKGAVDWRRFWFHNVLVARLTDKISGIFRPATGMEYLAGLLHDVGKLMVEHYFRREFERVVTLAAERNCNHADVEREVLGLDHTQIGAAMCDCMNIHPHVLRAVRFHHDSLNLEHTSDSHGDGGFLATCISIADKLANNRVSYIEQKDRVAQEIERSQEWKFLQRLFLPQKIVLNLEDDVKKAQEDLTAFLS